jgi:hypothetical protein
VTAEGSLAVWLAVWGIAAAYLLVRHWRSGLGAGLVFTYVLSLSAIHWLAPAMYLLPWNFSPLLEPTVAGLRMSTLGLLGFVVGGELAALLAKRRRDPAVPITETPVDRLLVWLYLGVGVILYGVVFPVVSALPTVAALASAASSLMVVGVALHAWNGWQAGRRVACWSWLAASAIFPLVTLVVQGFLGYGFAAMVIVAAFVASFYRPRWHVVVVGLIVAYTGMSVYVTYMRDRRDIRAVVWGGEAIGSRLDRLAATFAETEWFSVNNADHVRRVDERLNQNALVGAAIDNIGGGAVPFGRGATIADATIALVPRALWPEKPVTAGSGDLVSVYTGIGFAEGTSVGIGHVLEWYVNFGQWGVILGFIVIGGVVVYVDRGAGYYLHHGDPARFVRFFLPGLSLLQVGGSFVELTSSAAAAWIMAVAVNWAVGAERRQAPMLAPEAEPLPLEHS